MSDDNARTIHQIAADMHRQQGRDRKPLYSRLHEAINRAAMLSGIASSQGSDTGYTTSGKTEGKLPQGVGFTKEGDVSAHADVFNLEPYLAPIRHHVERLEQAIDDELGLSQSRHHATKTGDQLDEEIKAWEGTQAHVVSVKAPWLGSPRTIERRRHAMGLKPSNGEPMQLRAA